MHDKSEIGEIVVYQPDEITRLEVRLEDETVWLTQSQMADLFGRDRTVITKHIRNIFAEKELDENSNVHSLHFANSDKPVKLFSLDVIISVGYRVKSIQGTRFRQWANRIIKEYLLKGCSVHPRIIAIESRLDQQQKQIDFFIRTSLPPVEGIFYDGQVFDAYVFVNDLIKSARIRLDLQRHNSQYEPINIVQIQNIHDRFLIVDDDVYHIGASLKDLGKKLFAFSKMKLSPTLLLI